jgi:hypothetical protein
MEEKIIKLADKLIRNIKEAKKDKEIKDLKKRVEKLEKRDKPKTLFQEEWEKQQNWLKED